MIDGPRHHQFDSPFGPIVTVWSAEKGTPQILRIFLPGAKSPASERAGSAFPGSRTGSSVEIESAAERIAGFLEGDAVDFDTGITRMDLCPDFQRSVLLAEHAIPRGRVSTYGLIARHIGSKGAARAVGSALAGNPFPIIIPCHRAVRADLTPGGYQGGAKMKRALLEMEGISFDRSGKLDIEKGSLWYRQDPQGSWG
jgi:methylated-DNA-[protein]-cysteine S-methyltransferase